MPLEVTELQSIGDEQRAKDYVRGAVGDQTFAVLERYVRLLLVENQKQNLISKPSEASIWQRHIADSVQLLRFVPRETDSDWLDLGSGPGLPGIVIAACRPREKFSLVESRKRRVEFLESCVEKLDLQNCTIKGCRLEAIEPLPVRVITARAFAPMKKLLDLSAPFSTAETHYILPKGRSASDELQSLKPKVRKMFHVEQSLTDPNAGIIVGSRSTAI